MNEDMVVLPPGWLALDQAARDAAYNNGAATPDRDAQVAARNAASETLRAARPAHLDVPYGAAPRQAWDLFPAADPAAPCLIFIHGGYWQANSREGFACVIEGALAKGWSAALPGYTLAPDVSITGIVDELHRALTWLAEHGPAHGIGGGKKVLSGWSAGGHLAAALVDHPSVTAGLAISGIFELAPLRDTYLNVALKMTEDEIAALSPIRWAPSQKRLAVAYGTGELPEMQRQSRSFHAMRSAAHCPGWLVPVSAADHFRTLAPLREPDGELMQVVEALIK